MNFQTKISHKVNEDIWLKRLLDHKASSVYQTPNWSKTYFETFESKPIFVTVLDNEGNIVGQLSALLHTKYFWADSNILSKTLGSKLKLGSTIFWRYGPIIHDKKNFDEIIKEIFNSVEDFAEKNNVSFIRGSFPPLSNYNSESFLHNRNYTIKKWSTYITSLDKKSEELFNSLDKSVRYDVRKGEKNELEFEVATDFSLLQRYSDLKYNAKERAGQRRGKVPTFYKNEWKNLHEEGLGKLMIVKHKGKPISGILCFVFNKNIIQHGVVNSENTKLQGGSFATWNTLKWFLENNYVSFDMSGVNPEPSSKKEARIDFFKSKWGGEKYDYFTFMKILDKQKAKISFALQDPRKILSKITEL